MHKRLVEQKSPIIFILLNISLSVKSDLLSSFEFLLKIGTQHKHSGIFLLNFDSLYFISMYETMS